MTLFKPARLLWGLGLVVLVVSMLSLFADFRQLREVLRGFSWGLAVPALGLTLAGYGARFGRWQGYLRTLAISPLSTVNSALVFLAGFSMAITPGKMGEVIKAVFLRRLTGAPVSRTSAIVVAERVTDVVGMLILASLGLVSFSYGRPFLALAVVAAAGFLLLLQRPGPIAALAARAEGWPVVGPRVPAVIRLVGASQTLLRPRLLLPAVGLSTVGWGCECAAFLLILVGLGLPLSWHLALVATFVLALSSLLGAVSMLPGGLGVAEASVVGMLLLLLPGDVDRGTAAAATLLIRFATLWFAVILGLLALMVLRRTAAWRAEGEEGPVAAHPGDAVRVGN